MSAMDVDTPPASKDKKPRFEVKKVSLWWGVVGGAVLCLRLASVSAASTTAEEGLVVMTSLSVLTNAQWNAVALWAWGTSLRCSHSSALLTCRHCRRQLRHLPQPHHGSL